MTNVDKLIEIGCIGDIRQRLGAKDENDTSRDDKINSLSNTELVELWCGWHLGSGSWWLQMKGLFDKLENYQPAKIDFNNSDAFQANFSEEIDEMCK